MKDPAIVPSVMLVLSQIQKGQAFVSSAMMVPTPTQLVPLCVWTALLVNTHNHTTQGPAFVLIVMQDSSQSQQKQVPV
jgi:hypothetical protein